MEGLETGQMTTSGSDPLLSAALSNCSPTGPHNDDFRNHLPESNYLTLNGGRTSPHNGSNSTNNAIFSQYTTLTPLQPLPPISTVTNSSEKFVRSNSPTPESRTSSASSNLFFQQNATNSLANSLNFGSFAYNVNIKYEYDMKNDQESDDVQASDSTSTQTTTDYVPPVTLHQQLQQLSVPFSQTQTTYAPSYSTVMELRPSKQLKLCFGTPNSFNNFNSTSDIIESGSIDDNDEVSYFVFLRLRPLRIFFELRTNKIYEKIKN